MPTHDGKESVFGIQIGSERTPIIIGDTTPSKALAESQLIEDRVDFLGVKLGIVEIKPGEKYEVATIATPGLH